MIDSSFLLIMHFLSVDHLVKFIVPEKSKKTKQRRYSRVSVALHHITSLHVTARRLVAASEALLVVVAAAPTLPMVSLLRYPLFLRLLPHPHLHQLHHLRPPLPPQPQGPPEGHGGPTGR